MAENPLIYPELENWRKNNALRYSGEQLDKLLHFQDMLEGQVQKYIQKNGFENILAQRDSNRNRQGTENLSGIDMEDYLEK